MGTLSRLSPPHLLLLPTWPKVQIHITLRYRRWVGFMGSTSGFPFTILCTYIKLSITNAKLKYVIQAWSISTECNPQHTLNRSLKYGLQTDSTILWAWTNWPPAANVTSTKSSPCNNAWKPDVRLLWKLFQRKENWSLSPSDIILNLGKNRNIQCKTSQTSQYSQILTMKNQQLSWRQYPSLGPPVQKTSSKHLNAMLVH